MPRPQRQTGALRTRLSVVVCAESPAPDSLMFIQNDGREGAPSGPKLGGHIIPQTICLRDNGTGADKAPGLESWTPSALARDGCRTRKVLGFAEPAMRGG
jgi:hypothetical protein